MDRLLRYCAAAALMIGFCTAPGQAAEEPVTLANPGFEDGIEGWSTWYARQPVKVTTVDGPNGKCLRALGDAGSRVVISQSFVAEPLAWYTVRYRFSAAPNGASGGAMGYCRITFYDQNGTFLDYPSTEPFLDTFGEWTEAEQTFKTPLSIGEVSIGFNQSGASDLCVDDVSAARVDPPAPAPNTWAQLARRRDEPLLFSSWDYRNSAGQFREMGLKYGWRYVLEEQYEDLRESRTVPFWRGEETYAAFSRHGLKACPYLYYGALVYRNTHYSDAPPEDIPYILDPVWHDGYVVAAEEACRTLGDDPGLAYLFVQDESYGRFKAAPIAQEERVSPLWAELDETVRREYGGGVYGLPTGPGDENVYRWIAYYRWVQDRWADTFGRLRQTIEQSGCDVKLLGPDEVGVLMPLPWHRLAESVDVFTGQCLYSRGSAREYIAGFTTKYARDLTGKPVHNATQVVKYSGSPPPEEVQRQYSEVLRNGGEGEMMIGVEWFDRELNHHKYSAPERWATIKNLLRLMSEYQVQTPRESQVALLYSSISGMAQRAAFNSDDLLAAYAICGPKLRGWPTIVDSYALHEGAASLDGYSVVIVPHMPYETRRVVEQLRRFVRRGGLLVFANPQALQTDDLGEPLHAAGFLGATAEPLDRQREMSFVPPGFESERLRIYADDCFALTPFYGAGSRVVAHYGSGKPAAVLTELGDGAVLTFGADPFASTYVSEDAEWVAWWGSVLRARGMQTDLPIWDLRLPDEALVQAERPEGVCLTGNSYVRCQNGVYLGANAAVDGTYSLSVAPDLSPESGGEGTVGFAAGDLTDRVQATKGPFDSSGRATTPYAEADWADRWSAEALADGLEIEFALPEARDLSRVVLWYSGGFDGLTVSGGDGARWTRLASVRGESAGQDVLDLTVSLRGSHSRVKLQFTPSGEDLALADVELWAQE